MNVASPEGYWAYARAAPTQMYADAVAASSRDARATGQFLGHDGLDLVRGLAQRATQALAAVGDDDVVATAVGGMRVRDWMQTRTFELVVHGMDAAEAANVPIEFAAEPVSEALILAASIATAVGDGPVVLRALTGRAVLPNGFSVV